MERNFLQVWGVYAMKKDNLAENLDKLRGKRLQVARKAMGLTQEKLAELVGVCDGASISNMERGNRTMTDDNIQRFSEALNVTPEWLKGKTQFSDGKHDVPCYGSSDFALMRYLESIGIPVTLDISLINEEQFCTIAGDEYEDDFTFTVSSKSFVPLSNIDKIDCLYGTCILKDGRECLIDWIRIGQDAETGEFVGGEFVGAELNSKQFRFISEQCEKIAKLLFSGHNLRQLGFDLTKIQLSSLLNGNNRVAGKQTQFKKCENEAE